MFWFGFGVGKSARFGGNGVYLCYGRSKTSMATLWDHMEQLGNPTSNGQQAWHCLWIRVFRGSCANKTMLLIPL